MSTVMSLSMMLTILEARRHGNMFQIFRQKDCLQIGMLLKILDCARPAHDEKGSAQSIGFRGVIVNDSYGG